MEVNVKKLIIALSIALSLYLIFSLFKIKVKVSADVLNVKLRIQVYIFGFLRLINLKIYYNNCQIFLQKPSGKTSPLYIKPMGKFQTKFSFNAMQALVDKSIYINLLCGIEDDAYTTSLINGGIYVTASSLENLIKTKAKTKLNMQINSTAKQNAAKIFMQLKVKTSIAKIFKALLVSI